VDSLSAISPGGANTWTPRIIDPGSGIEITPSLSGVGQDVIKVYVGSRSLAVAELGLASAGTATAAGSAAFTDNAASRGQAGALATPKSDYGPWGGSVAFDADTNWYTGLSPGGLTANKIDLLTVATHELVHLLGFSIAQPSFAASVNNGRFTGPNATAANAGTAPSVIDSHWSGMTSTVGPGGVAQVALMDPAVQTGVRRRATLLDWGALDDIGWDIAIPGDANANGVVDFGDFQTLELGFGQTNARWAQGDFNEDGAIDTADFSLLLRNYGKRMDGTDMPISAAEQQALSAYANALGVPAPEPSLSAAIAGLAMVVMRRRRR
jgi:hypothetical protein